MAASCLINWVYRDTCPRIVASSTAQPVTQDLYRRERGARFSSPLLILETRWQRKSIKTKLVSCALPQFTVYCIKIFNPLAISLIKFCIIFQLVTKYLKGLLKNFVTRFLTLFLLLPFFVTNHHTKLDPLRVTSSIGLPTFTFKGKVGSCEFQKKFLLHFLMVQHFKNVLSKFEVNRRKTL